MDIADNGIDVRFTRQLTGDNDFTEEVLAGARAPLFNVIGGIDNGWRVAMTVLGYERGQMATVQHLALERKFWQTIEEARRSDRLGDDALRRELVAVHARIQALRACRPGILAGTAFDRDIERISSTSKIFLSELDQRLSRVSFDIRGAAGLVRPSGDGYPLDQWQHDLLHSAMPVDTGRHERDSAQHPR